jgi:hypothetical protein
MIGFELFLSETPRNPVPPLPRIYTTMSRLSIRGDCCDCNIPSRGTKSTRRPKIDERTHHELLRCVSVTLPGQRSYQDGLELSLSTLLATKE